MYFISLENDMCVRCSDSVDFYNIGNDCVQHNDLKEAIDEYTKCINSNPFEKLLKNAYYNRAIVFSEIGKIEEAKKDYQAALKIDPSYRPAINNLRNLDDE